MFHSSIIHPPSFLRFLQSVISGTQTFGSMYEIFLIGEVIKSIAFSGFVGIALSHGFLLIVMAFGLFQSCLRPFCVLLI